MRTRPINKSFKRSFRSIHDPGMYLLPRKDDKNVENSCLPACLAILLEYNSIHAFRGYGIRNTADLSCKKIRKTIEFLKFENLLNFGKTGIPLCRLKEFEKINFPFNRQLKEMYPILNFLHGFSINVYRISYSSLTKNYRLFPVVLSEHHNSLLYYQCDLILDSPVFYENPSQKVNENHFLVATRLLNILQSYHSKDNHNRHIFQFFCRACLSLFLSRNKLHDHYQSCGHKEGVFKRKKRLNILIHRPYKPCYGDKKVKDGLTFERGMVKYCLKNLCTTYMDFESVNKEMNESLESDEVGFCNDVRLTNIVFNQVVVGVSLIHKSHYEDDFPLPPAISEPRCFFRDERYLSSNDFYLKLLYQLRNDMIEINKFHENARSCDLGTPSFSSLSLSEKIHYLTSSNCALCGKYFNRNYVHGITKKKYRVIKVKDHLHYKRDSSNYRSPICSYCNLNMKDTDNQPQTIFMHNASGEFFFFSYVFFLFFSRPIFLVQPLVGSLSNDYCPAKFIMTVAYQFANC